MPSWNLFSREWDKLKKFSSRKMPVLNMPCIAVMLEKGIDLFSEAGCEEGEGEEGEEGEEDESGEYCFILEGREM